MSLWERSLEEMKMSGIDVTVTPSRMFGLAGSCFMFVAPIGPKDMKIIQVRKFYFLNSKIDFIYPDFD